MARAKATDGLSEAGRRAMLQGFAAGWRSERVAQAIKDATGEIVAERTVARRAAEWAFEVARRKAARERMEDLVAAAEKGGVEVSGFIRALALETLEGNPEALTSADPIALHGMALAAEQVRLKKREVDIRERKVAVEEKRQTLAEARDARVQAALEVQPGEAVTPEERLRRVQEIYGIAG